MAPNSDNDQDFTDNSGDEFDTSDEDNDPDVNYEVNHEERRKQAREHIRKTEKFTEESEVEAFLRRYNDIAGKIGAKAGGNLLHTLVEVLDHNGHIKPEGVELLARSLVERRPDVLEDLNTDGHNPVYMAIRYNQDKLVGYMVSACNDTKDNACLNRALSQKAQDGNTCLHAIFQKKPGSGHDSKAKRTSRRFIQRMLIEVASDDALAVQDNSGMTPMHYAVAFDRCTDERTELIELFIDRDLQALQKNRRWQQRFLDLLNDKGRSVYTEHERSRKAQERKHDAKEASRRQDAGASKQTQVDTARSAARPAPRDRGRELRQGAQIEPNRERRNGDADDGLLVDKREELRRKRKEEEQAKRDTRTPVVEDGRRYDDTDGPMRIGRVGERDVMDRAAALAQSTKPDGFGDKPSISALRTDTASRFSEPAPNTPIKRSSTARLDSNPEQRNDKETELLKTAEKSRVSTDDIQKKRKRMKELLRNSDTILLKLKLHYMRTRSAELAISFLYGNNIDDIQISFDYDRLPRKMAWNQFEKRFGANKEKGLRFDSVLQYVAFPRVEVILSGRKADREEADIQSGRQVGGMGRKDMRYFFDWLYKKGVRHIIRVSVEDSGDSGERVHSDRAIQECLEKFVVEQLDWKKTDLDPETILSVSSKVEKRLSTFDKQEVKEIVQDRQLRKLFLRWGGSNAVLPGWSEPEGLAKLPLLQEIILFAPPANKMYDSNAWIQAKVRDFEDRLNANRLAHRERAQGQSEPGHTAPDRLDVGDMTGWFGEVSVNPSDSDIDDQRTTTSGEVARFATSTPTKGVNSHRWLVSTVRFAKGMTGFWQSIVKKFEESKPTRRTKQEGLENDVVLALIDDGVDMFNTPQTDNILEGKSFDYHDEKVRPPFSSAKGHGTLMAKMILRVCPMVKIYPIRLKTYDTSEGKSMIDPGYAAQAIQAALDKKATIISMSWTIPMTSIDSKAKQKLHDVLQKAVDRGVLAICSAPDKGKFTESHYPSGPWGKRFFRIGAAGADGTVFQWTPDDDITCVVPGVDVDPEEDFNSAYDAERSLPTRIANVGETGSSVATALAAGLAAMIIYCVKASVLIVKTRNHGNSPSLGNLLQDNAPEVVAHPEEMKNAFESLGKVTPNHFIQVWEELDSISDKLERWSRLDPEAKEKIEEAFVDFGLKLYTAATAQKH
ncbi:hypothetical protein C7999DRAFT_35426 [Corynascus novoguineensis]|uniref:Peptidase S8/S53 domain-containing protein n=1 Tax=Corynascus novoguineensis TaxID=1126955 RepID=A0AAN7CL95_9PEZI|nr:hypothetical protein C7999DRAFT_35426 [Corynascus novoguineensis]